MKVLVIGSVTSTAVALEALLDHHFNVLGVIGYEPRNKEKVSGFFDLRSFCQEKNIEYKPFTNINSDDVLYWAEQKKPDVILAIGFSQLLQQKWFSIPFKGIVGYHPTKLPRGRGRAPMAWIILNQGDAAATFFEMNEAADAGPIFIQQPIPVDERDDVESIRIKLLEAERKALDKWLPVLKKGEWNPVPQDDSQATFYGVRREEDGFIDWNWSAYKIDRLIKATTKPYPGAFTYYDRTKIIIWKSSIESSGRYFGVSGRILVVNDDYGILVKCGDNALWIHDFETVGPEFIPKVGLKLGIDIYEIFRKIYLNTHD